MVGWRPVLPLGVLLLWGTLGGVPSPSPAQEDPAERPREPDPEKAAVAAVERLRGLASRDDAEAGHPVTRVTFYEPVEDRDLDLLKAFKHLQGLDVYEGRITDAGLARLGELADLESLHIAKASLSGEGLRHLGKLAKLRHLSLSEVRVTDDDLATLARLARLRTVRLDRTDATDAGVARLKAALPYALIHRVGEADREVGRAGGGGYSVLLVGVVATLAVLAALPLFRRRSRELLRRASARKLACILGVISVAGIALLRVAPDMAPVREGDPATFWLQACRIDVGVKGAESLGGFYQPRDGWFIYYVQGFHGQFLYRVKAADSLAVFPRVARRLADAPPGALDPDVEQAAGAWLLADPGRTDAALLLAKLREARLARLRKLDRGVYEYALAAESDFADRWERSERYPWNVALEFAFLTGLILFAAWPWLRGAGYVRWALHVGLAPVLFFLPYWVGYAPLTFTSAGPTGGVLYPWLIVRFRGLPWTPLDTAIVRHLPQVLEPLSQTTGPMLSLSGGRGVGPVAATAMAAGLVLVIATTAVYRRSMAQVLRGETPVLAAVGNRVAARVRAWMHPGGRTGR